jgi:hypothetical protein
MLPWARRWGLLAGRIVPLCKVTLTQVRIVLLFGAVVRVRRQRLGLGEEKAGMERERREFCVTYLSRRMIPCPCLDSPGVAIT